MSAGRSSNVGGGNFGFHAQENQQQQQPAPPMQQTPLSNKDIDAIFKKLDIELLENIDSQYFSEPREFRSLIEVLAVLGPKADQISGTSDASTDLLAILKDRNPAYSKLLNQRQIVEEVIEEVVTLQHGGLNNSVDTMSEVVKEYTRGRDEIRALQKSLHETKAVLTARKTDKTGKTGQVPLKELWLRKVELQESLRMVRDLETLRSTPSRVQRMMQQKRYLSAVMSLTRAITSMFSEDLVGVSGLEAVREHVMELKESMLETCVRELREVIIGLSPDVLKDENSDSEDEMTADDRSQSAPSVATTSQFPADENFSIKSASRGTSTAVFPSHHAFTTTTTAATAAAAAIAAAAATERGSNSSTVNGGSRYRSGGSSRPPTVAGASNSSSGGHILFGNINSSSSSSSSLLHPWSTDFRGIDEALEVSLADPSTTGSLYIRLLVKAISLLQLEEDVERMILDTVGKSFQISSVRRLREVTAAKQSRVAARVKSSRIVSEEEDFMLQTKLFTGFVAASLDTSLLSLKRLLYVLRLLHLSKLQRSTATAAVSVAAAAGSNRSNGAAAAYSPAARQRSDSYGSSGSSSALSSPWGGATITSAATAGTAATTSTATAAAAVAIDNASRKLKENLRAQVVSVWLEIQDAIVRQITAHLVEPDVQDITDHVAVTPDTDTATATAAAAKSSTAATANAAVDSDSDDDLLAAASRTRGDFGGRRNSISAAFLRTSAGLRRGEDTSSLRTGRLGTYSVDSNGDNNNSNSSGNDAYSYSTALNSPVTLLFRPSARHAAPLYRRVVLFHQLLLTIMRDNGINDPRLHPSTAAAAVSKTTAAAAAEVGGWKTLSEDENNPSPRHSTTTTAAVRKYVPGSAIRRGTSLLEVIQTFLEAELIPVMQSTVNHVMRDIQLNSELFSVVREGDENKLTSSSATTAAAASGDTTSAAAAVGFQLCQAVELCNSASRPLFSYWLQLCEHRSMVSTVLDRLLRGYAAAAREEMETLTYSWISATKKHIAAAVLKALKSDPLFQTYRATAYGTNKLSADDFFNNSSSSNSSSSSGNRRSFATPTATAAAAGKYRYSSSSSSSAAAAAAGGTTTTAGGTGSQQAQQHYEQQESEAWGNYWNIDDIDYPISSQTIARDFSSIATVAAIAYGCDWLVKNSSSSTSLTLKKITATTTEATTAAATTAVRRGSRSDAAAATAAVGNINNNNNNNNSTMRSTATATAAGNSSKQELQEAKTALVTTVVAGCRQLSKIAEEGFSLLRAELQLACFHFMHRLAHIQYATTQQQQQQQQQRRQYTGSNSNNNNSSSIGGGAYSPTGSTSTTATTTAAAAAGGRKNSGNLFRPSSSFSVSATATAAAAVSSSSAAAAAASLNATEEMLAGRGLAEEEAILASFSGYLSCFFDAVLTAAPADALALIFSPLCALVPRILVRCAMTMAAAASPAAAATQQRQQLLQQSSLTLVQLQQLQRAAGAVFALSHLSPKQQKAFLLRVVVIVQQNLALHLQALPFSLLTRRRLLDKLTEGFEHCRRFITLFGMPAAELKAYLLKNPSEYGKEEAHVLWQKSTDTAEEFASLWSEVETARFNAVKSTAAAAANKYRR